jgi:hypothetical protein
MNPSLKITGSTQLRKRLAFISKRLERSVPSILAQEGRALAAEYGSATVPGPGFDEAKIQKFARRIESEIRRVFASASNASAVYQRLRAVAPDFAAAYWRQHKLGKPRAQAAILRQAGIAQQSPDAGSHRAARTNRRARVPTNQVPVAVVPEAQLKRYIRTRVANAGFAKAAWYVASLALGGRARRTVNNDDGTRTSVQIFPTSLRKIGRANPHIGGALITGRGINTAVQIFSNVAYAASALPTGLRQSANARAAERTRKSIAKALQQTNRASKTSTAAA